MRKIVVLALLVLALAGLVITFNYINRPIDSMTDAQKEAAVAKILGRKPNLTDTTPKGNKSYNGKNSSFSYPASAVTYNYRDPNIAKNTNVLEIFSFDISNPRLIFNFSVISYPNISNISDIPDVRFRQIEEYGYSQASAFADGKGGLVFEKQEGTGKVEKTAFFLINGKSYSFSFQGADSKEVDKLYDLVLGSVKFTNGL